MKHIVAALSVAGSVAGFLAWFEEHSNRPGAQVLAFQLTKEHAWLGMIAGMLVLIG